MQLAVGTTPSCSRRPPRRIADDVATPVRVEFLIAQTRDGKAMPLVWQIDRRGRNASSAFAISHSTGDEERDASLVFDGAARCIDELDHLDTLSNSPRDDEIVVVRPSRLCLRSRGSAVELARRISDLDHRFLVLTSPLSHLAALLREFGCSFWPVSSIPEGVRTGTRVAVRRRPSSAPLANGGHSLSPRTD